MTADYAELLLKRNRGWPWPQESWGLTPMFGDDGWCRGCGVPQRQQSGNLVLQATGLKSTVGAWIPHWLFDTICLGDDLASKVRDEFDVHLVPVMGRTRPLEDVQQIVIPSTGDPWFEPGQLERKVLERRDIAGAECSACGIWRWMPMPLEALPPPNKGAFGDQPAVASPEWFGDGHLSFRQVLVRQDLAELLASHSPRDFSLRRLG